MDKSWRNNLKSSWLIIRPRWLPVSWRIPRQVPKVLLILGLVSAIAILVSIGIGDYPIPIVNAIETVFGIASNPDYQFIVNLLRLPRTIVAFLVGFGLGIAGTITQGITRNPLAAPDIIGINAGASLAAVSLITLFPDVPITLLPWAAFGGALTVSLLIYWVAWREGCSPTRLILVGVGFSLIGGALTNLMLTFGQIGQVSQALVWLTGSVYGRSWEQAFVLLPWIVVFGLLSLLLAQELNILNLGDDIARSLGSPIEWQRGLLLLSSVALAGASVSIAGTIGFVGLMAPHLARQLVGGSHEGLLPVAAMMGGMLVVLADLLGRMLFVSVEVPCGLITSAIGAPYFIYLLIRNR